MSEVIDNSIVMESSDLNAGDGIKETAVIDDVALGKPMENVIKIDESTNDIVSKAFDSVDVSESATAFTDIVGQAPILPADATAVGHEQEATANQEATFVDESGAAFSSVAGENATLTSVDGTTATFTNADGQTFTTTVAGDGTTFEAVDAEGGEVQYVTMTPEEAAAAGVMEEEQVVTTSLQFDPANPSVLYTADGTLINQADLSPEEQALVQAALQQHLAEQEAEQQLAMIESGEQMDLFPGGEAANTTASLPEPNTVEPVATITPATTDTAPVGGVATNGETNQTAPENNASQIVQTLADNVRRQKEYEKAQQLLIKARGGEAEPNLPEGYKYEEKIVIRQGQPQVVKMAVKDTPAVQNKKPEIPAALANLMPKIEIGKDGSQVIRIHQSQITADQLKSLQENPNVRLVFRPASASRSAQKRPTMTPIMPPRKRGRPRKSVDPLDQDQSPDYDPSLSPTSTTRYGRTTKQPYHNKDFESPNESLEDGESPMSRQAPRTYVPGRRGRPPGSLNKATIERAYKKSNTYANKIDALRRQEINKDDDDYNKLSIIPPKPLLNPIEQAISTRRKNRLRELLSACSNDEIMEVALPHLARVFSLWEFLLMKVEKNKLSRVYFADVYKEYEALHRYVSRLTEKYKEAVCTKLLSDDVIEGKVTEVGDKVEGAEEKVGGGEDSDKEKSNVRVQCKELARALGLKEDELEDVFINLLDSQEHLSQSINNTILQQAKNVDSPTPSTSNAATDQTETAQSVENNAAVNSTEEQASGEVQVEGKENSVETNELDKESSSATVTAEQSTIASTTPMDVDQQPDQQPSDTNPQTSEPDALVENGENTIIAPSSSGTQIIQIGTGDEKQFIEVPEGYTLIQTPEGLVMSQPGTTLSQSEDGTIYVTQEDGTTAPLDSQKGIPLETVESLMSLEGQPPQAE